MKQAYEDNGYFVIKNFIEKDELQELFDVLVEFHESWKYKNADFYSEKAINSAYITGVEHLEESKRAKLFQFIGSTKLMNIVSDVIKKQPTFMNTQLFFNPVNPQQKDFWHRDCQYDHEVEEQKKVIYENQVVHFRVPLFDELGMELVPGTHK